MSIYQLSENTHYEHSITEVGESRCRLVGTGLSDGPLHNQSLLFQERMIYVPAEESTNGIAKVVYTSKDKKSRKVFMALDWLVTHIPSWYEQTV